MISRVKVCRRRPWRRKIGILLALCLGLLLGLPACLSAIAAPGQPLAGHRRVREQPATCLLGVYIQDLRDFQFTQNSLFASVRLWSVCPSTKQSPLNELNVLNANNISLGEIHSQKVTNGSDYFRNDAQVHWSTRSVEGTFFHHWIAKNFPFDRHIIEFEFELLKDDINTFVFTPDFAHSGFSPTINNENWIAKSFSINEIPIRYTTNFGKPDPRSSEDGSYSRIKVQLTLQRTRGVTSFLKLCAGVYAATVMSGMAFVLDMAIPALVGSRNGILVGCLFAAIVSMQKAEATLGATEDVTLTDMIHIVSIFYILAASLLGFAAYLWCEAGRGEDVVRISRRIALPAYMISYGAINILLIAYAAIIG